MEYLSKNSKLGSKIGYSAGRTIGGWLANSDPMVISGLLSRVPPVCAAALLVSYPVASSSSSQLTLLRPTLEIMYDGIPSSPRDYPNNVVVAIVDLLVLGVCRDQGKIPRSQLVASVSVGATDDGTVSLGRIDYRVWRQAYQMEVGRWTGFEAKENAGGWPPATAAYLLRRGGGPQRPYGVSRS